jgi:hypothetical protein
MTKIELFKNAITLINTSNGNLAEINEVVEGLNHEIELLQRKASTPRKPTKTQLENEGFKTAIVSYLTEEGEPRTVKSIMETIEELGVLSNQRVTHLLTALRNEGKVKRTVVKKTPYYEIGEDEAFLAAQEN